MTQLELPLTGKLSIAERFAVFHGQHPEVYDRLREMALRLRRNG